MSSWVGLGLMSGSSLDGLDLCCVEFTGDFNIDIWSHRILKAKRVKYSPKWIEHLKSSPHLSGQELIKLDRDYAHLLGEEVEAFLQENVDLSLNFVASHGHTVFHQPENRFNFELGDGETIVSHMRCPLVANFRNKDVALGGQGAPLVPVGESYLFSQYAICINLGGICNVSIHKDGFDICPCNLLLNYLVSKHDPNLDYDVDGRIAESGKVIPSVLEKLNSLSYYQLPPPKSLGQEWFEQNVIPILQESTHSTADMLRTAVEHVCDQIMAIIVTTFSDALPKSLLLTGGGAHNSFLMRMLSSKLKNADVTVNITECDDETTNFKEALIFAFLGLRCLLGLPNISKTVTGASFDSVSGSIHLPPVSSPLANAVVQDYSFHFRKRQKSISENCFSPAIKEDLFNMMQ